MSADPFNLLGKHTPEREGDGMQPVWVHQNKGRNRAERRAVARKKRVLPPPATNHPFEKKED